VDVLAPVLNFNNGAKVQNAVSATTPKEYTTLDQLNQEKATTDQPTYTVGNEGFLRGFGTSAIAVTIPSSRSNPITIKHVGTQDMTIVFQSSTIDGNSNLVLRGGKKQSVTLYFDSGGAWIT